MLSYKFKLTTPVVFIIFNRPEPTKKVFAEIAKAKPSKLFVIADGPRSQHSEDKVKVAATREIIKLVDWECEVITNFSDINLGCKKRVSSGIDWVFKQVTEAIILEDDCLPDKTFFRFCQELLENYRDDQRVGMISGNNFQFGSQQNNNSYYFSKYSHIWGWATWSDRWLESYDVNISRWPNIRDRGELFDLIENKHEANYWKRIFDRVYNNEIDTWDFQWVLTNFIENRLNVMPVNNLITNIGFDKNATHTKSINDVANMERLSIKFPLIHPNSMSQDIKADEFTYINMFKKSLSKRLVTKIVSLMKYHLGFNQ